MPEYLDRPQHGRFDSALPVIAGWYGTENRELLDEVVLQGPEGAIPFQRVSRPDAESHFPGHRVLGFTASVESLFHYPEFEISLVSKGKVLTCHRLEVTESARQMRQDLARKQHQKIAWCREHLRCPVCHNPKLEMTSVQIRCPRCGTEYPQSGTRALNFLTPDLYRSCSLSASSNVSEHGLGQKELEMIAEISAQGGKILDCGAGWKPTPWASETVINVEIVDYPSTDVLAVGQSLPFRDAVFDAVFSFAVLEHVSDPFTCARELVRVLKPGGQLNCQVPFLQPERGYPHHYYNMTRQGILNLFRDLEVESHDVPPWGYPMCSLWWMINSYAANLPPNAREDFLNMRMRDVLSRQPVEWNSEAIVSELSEAGRWELACVTALLLRKPV